MLNMNNVIKNNIIYLEDKLFFSQLHQPPNIIFSNYKIYK